MASLANNWRLSSVERASMTEQVLRELREAIIEGRIPQGEALREVSLAGTLGMGDAALLRAASLSLDDRLPTVEALRTGEVIWVESLAERNRRYPELAEADLTGSLFLLIGGERRGVTRSFVEQADERIRIGYGRERAPELGAAASAAIIGFEALRQRRAGR